ncbi:MAG: major capsid protein [Microvirus sp.]|nr:MAG: major capsid protein [Microvirus sp.]
MGKVQKMFRNKSVDVHQFAMIPKADIPRSTFKIETTHKTTFDSGYLVPIYVDEILPGDTFKVNMTAFARLSTPIFPVMDNLHMSSFFFFVPNRLVWENWVRFMGEQSNPTDSINYAIPTLTCPASGYAVNSIYDYLGLPTVGQVTAAATFSHNVLPLRAINLIYNEWFRDENLQNALVVRKTDAGDHPADFALFRRGKRKDYFTGALPWPQKGNTAVSLPLGTTAPVVTTNAAPTFNAGGFTNTTLNANAGQIGAQWGLGIPGTTTAMAFGATTGLYADLSTATAATINQLRQAFQIQRLLERDARGGTRYTEIIRSHFGVISPDARLQRPEYLGGGENAITYSPIAQTSATGVTGGSTPIGNISAMATAVSNRHGFTQSFTEHGYVIGFVSVRADINYQQGLRKMWSRSTRYDFYFPAFAMLGEQAILNKEIYLTGTATDNQVFGYQERWAEYRYHPSMITGLFKSTSSGTIDNWHLAQRFTSLPTLNTTFIQETPPLQRTLAVGAAAQGKELIFDSFIEKVVSRPLPMYSVPGMMDHF